MYTDSLTGAPADHGMRHGLVPPAEAEQEEEEAAQQAERPADHVEIEKSNVLILVREKEGQCMLSATIGLHWQAGRPPCASASWPAWRLAISCF